jgi:hypothetical protein
MKEEVGSEWKWINCSFDLKRVVKDVEHYENLEPVSILTIKERV